MAVSRIDEAGLNVTQYGNRNLIINGAMQVAQRGTSSSSQGIHTVDRFQATSDSTYTTAVITQEQAADGPDGFTNSYKVTVGTTEALGAAKYFYVQHKAIEAQNLQHLQFGSSTAKKITLSFWVKSSVTGTYTMSAFRHDAQRIYPKTYTIDAANTWEYKTITMDGDTTGTIANDTGRGLDIYFILSAGSNYNTGTDGQWAAYVTTNYAANHTADVLGTTSATWQVTGVQLEVGDTATGFEHRSYGDELLRCQRYFQKQISTSSETSLSFCRGQGFASGSAYVYFEHPVEMRVKPSLSDSIGSVGNLGALSANGGGMGISGLTYVTAWSSVYTTVISLTVYSGTFTAGQATELDAGGNSGAFLAFDAEL